MLQFQFNILFFSLEDRDSLAQTWQDNDISLSRQWYACMVLCSWNTQRASYWKNKTKKTKKTKSTFISVVTRVRTCLARTFNVWLQRHHDWKECRRRAIHLLNQMCYGIGYFMLYNPEPCSGYIIVVLHFSDRDRSRKIFFLSSRLTVRLLIAIHWLFS